MVPMLRSVLSAVAIAAGGLLVQASDASASIFYNWSGTCTYGCSGTSTAQLEVRDSYAAGNSLRRRDFVSFSYNSSSGSFSISDRRQVTSFSGRLPAAGTTSNSNIDIDFRGFGTYHFTNGNFFGTWDTAYRPGGVRGQGGYGSNWSADLPAPGSLLALAGALLAGFVVYRRREDEDERTGSIAAA